MNNLTFVSQIIKSINYETDESPGNNGLTAEFFKHISNELAPVLLDYYDPLGILDTMDVTSRTGTMSVIFKNRDKKDDWGLQNYRPIYYNC